MIVNNDFIKSAGNLPLVFSRQYLTSVRDLASAGTTGIGAGEISYRPVATLSYFADYRLWKLKAFGYHLTSLLLHIINAILIFTLAVLLTGEEAIALPAALVFALHPVNTEAVNAIAFREDILAFLFFVSSFIFYTIAGKASGPKRVSCKALSLILFVPALFSKEMAITLPLVLILYDRYFKKQPVSKWPYFTIVAFYLLIWGVIFKNPNPPAAYPANSLYAGLLTMPLVFARYVQWAILPLNLHFTVTEPHLIVRHFRPEVLFSFLLLAGFLAAAIKMRKAYKVMSFCIIWFFLTLLPVANIFPLNQIIGMRYLYLPIAGFCILLPLCLHKISGRRAYAFIMAAILLFYSFVSMERIKSWKDNISLWSEIAGWYADNYSAHSGLAEVFLQEGRPDKAIKEFETALKLRPRSPELCYRLAGLYEASGNSAEAQKAYQKAIGLNPGYLEAYNDLAALYSETGRIKEAMALWNKALAIDPRFMTAHFNLAVFYFQDKQYEAAIRHTDAVVAAGGKVDPGFLELLKPYRKPAA